MITPRLSTSLVLLVLCSLGIGCTHTGAQRSRRAPQNEAAVRGHPGPDQVFHDALYVRTADGAWAEPGVNEHPGAVYIGETTRSDVLRLFGFPTQRRITVQGSEVWYYAAIRRAQATATSRGTGRTSRLRAQRKLVIAFAAGSDVVTAVHTYVSGERIANPFRDTGPPFPPLEP